jgi:hypothetical protein
MHGWRHLPTCPCLPRPLQAAKDVVLSEKPVIMDDSASLEPLLLDKLIAQVGRGAWSWHRLGYGLGDLKALFRSRSKLIWCC